MARALPLERSLALPSPRRCLMGAVVLVSLLASWPWIDTSFARAFAALSSLVLEELEFGRGGHASLAYAPAQESSLDSSWNVQLVLSIEDVDVRHAVRVNPQRTLFLPLSFFCAFMTLMPLTARRRALCLVLGALVLSLIATASLWIMAMWLFARVPGLVYDLTASEAALLHVGYEGFVTSTADKFIVPLFLALVLGLWQSVSMPVVLATVGKKPRKTAENECGRPLARRRKPKRSH